MTKASTIAGTPQAPARRPRRLARAARREQLVAAAMPIVAADGFSDFSLDQLAATADVTRNLVYHYFPRGRQDVALAVAEAAGHQLTDDWTTDESIPLPERLAINNGRMIEHAMEPTDAWTIYQLARNANDPELRERVDHFVDVVVDAVLRNHFGDAKPPPLARIAVQGYLGFFGAALEEARLAGMAPGEILGLLTGTLLAALEAAAAAD
jgi:AcrR family transcriptional regulator